MSRALHLVRSLACCLLAGTVLSPAVARATTGTARFGHPFMFVVTGKIPPPFQFRFDFGIAPSQWPALVDADHRDRTSLDQFGNIAVFHNYLATVSNIDMASSVSSENGTYSTETQMMDEAPAVPTDPSRWVGTFAYATWSQTFRKDSVGAFCRFTISALDVRARSVAIDSARAEVTLLATLASGDQLIDRVYQLAGVVAWTPTPFPPTLFGTWVIGPMPAPIQSDPSQSGHALMLSFAPYTHDFPLDDPRIAVGDTFTVTFEQMSQTAVGWGEFPGASATFHDPPAAGGIQIDVAGLTPIDGMLPNTSGVPGLAWQGTTTLSPAWPNPSRDAVNFTLELAQAGEIEVDVFDLGGRRVGSLAHGRYEAGHHALRWDPRAAESRPPSGVYFVRASGPGLQVTRRIARIEAP